MKGMSPQLDEGISLQRQGRLAEAEALYRAILGKTPDDAPTLHYLGLVNYQAGKIEAADAFMSRSLEIDRSCANTWNDLGAVKLKAGKPEESLRHFTRALELNDRHTDAMNNMAAALNQLHLFDKALVPLRRLAYVRPGSAAVMRNLADTLYHAGAVAKAVEAYHEALRLDPEAEAARLGMAEACEASGKFKQAKMHYLAVLRRDPDNSLALSKALQMREGKTDPAWVASAERLVERDDAETAVTVRLNIGLAYYYDRIGSYDTAFQRLKAARDEQAQRQPFDSGGYSSAIDTLIEVLSKDFFKSAETSGIESDRPIFIVGMPRSGTTLTEQILASHSRVAPGGELSALPAASYRILDLSADREPYPHGLKTVGAASLATLATQYLEQLDKLDTGGRRVTDKLPFNFMHLGLIPLLFPNARIIHCRRDPMDNCMSCYFTSFSEEIQFTNDLGRLGAYYADYHRLMKHWKQVLPIRVFDLRYEDLVSNTETAIRELLSYCDLDWDDACLKFYQVERGVRTPSRWQVRQPIYRNSVARWRNYERYLEPLKQGLGAALSEAD
jgi:tetratricopeptide (TPR) repeat protein